MAGFEDIIAGFQLQQVTAIVKMVRELTDAIKELSAKIDTLQREGVPIQKDL